MRWDRDAVEAPHTRRELAQIEGGSLQKVQGTANDPTEINTDPAYVREFAATCGYAEREMIIALLGKLEEAQRGLDKADEMIGAYHLWFGDLPGFPQPPTGLKPMARVAGRHGES
ncbi:hypothetical protein [Fuscibacter oryzae]|uniref:Uncharacterized protein n=1 Tax=Fuscibacter oryzae TaxID=2803939 RepID=A0A8J7MTL0_9RHOB|nr:hypothetical protein [Fuscibacter oryzae]MBL4929351.1 hypothetical protein [Fuscibacter oryzae]